MYYNYYRPSESEFNDCTSKGACSIPPSVSAFREVIIMLLRQLAYYIVKVNNIGVECDELKLQLVHSLAGIFTNAEYSDEEVYTSILTNYNNLIQTKEFYTQLCKDKNITPRDLRSEVKISSDMNLSKLMSLGEKIYKERNKKISANHKQLFEILLLVTQSLSGNIISLEDYTDVDMKFLDKAVEALDILNYPRTSILKIKKYISDIVSLNFELVSKLGAEIYDKFGEIRKVSVSMSSRPGKSILVSGSNLNDLNNLLHRLDGEDIDVYTHSDLLIAHALEKLSKYKNLYAHYGSGSENFMLDFATFPGSILLTRGAVKNLEYLYRGRLFSTDKIVPIGVSPVLNNDFSDLIESAKNARGFKTGKTKDSITVGYDVSALNDKLQSIANDFNSNTIKNLFIIGMTSLNTRNNDFYNELLANVHDDTFIITFGGEKSDKNILPLNLSNNVPLLYRLMNKFIGMLKSEYDRISFFISRCDANSLSTVIALKEHGFNKIYLSNCPPNSINPQTIRAFTKLYGINMIANPKEDIKSIIS